ncbi:hypothetical protein [Peribacillus simplex]
MLKLSSDFIEVVNNELKYDGLRVKYSDFQFLSLSVGFHRL